MLEISLKDNLNQAYIVVGDRKKAMEEIRGFLTARFGQAFISSQNQDFWCQEFDTFGIDEARLIKDVQSRRALTDTGRVFILSVGLITSEAQNALLKTLEEPAATNYFFILAQTRGLFLPTLLSRCQILTLTQNQEVDSEMTKLSQQFLKGDIGDRLKIAEEVADRHSRGQKTILPDLVNNLISVFKEGVDLAHLTKEELRALEELHKIAIKVSDRSASAKILLSHLALIIPIK